MSIRVSTEALTARLYAGAVVERANANAWVVDMLHVVLGQLNRLS